MWVARAEQDSRHVGGRYRLVEQLGSGGMSVVWRGYDEILGRQVAVKVLSSRLAGDQAFRDRLRQEALAAARLCHPHITGIFDYGESAPDGGTTVPYVVMELNDGESVSRRLSRRGPLPWREAVTMAAEVASALATAHARGVVHRDVTPANVMLTGAGAKVVDFGISALIGERDAAPDGSLLGTPAYLAPERLAGGHVLPATDVYALGLLLYRSLTARLPWPAGTTVEALRAHLYADPELLPSLPGMPAGVAALCLRCLAKDPADRPGAEDIAHILGEVVGLPVVIPPLPAADADQPAPAWAVAVRQPTRVSRPGRPPRPTRVPRPSPLRVLRLRTELRLAAVLRVGAARPLGGGLFACGRLGHGVFAVSRLSGTLLGGTLLGGRHRVQAAAATAALVAALGIGWAAADEPVPVGPAQAAAVGGAPAAGASRPVACRVRYQVRRDSGAAFDASLTVTNTGPQVVSGGRVEFAYPGTQRLALVAGVVSQRGRRVIVRAGTLRPGRPVGVALRGSYRDMNPLPLSFTLAGQSCRVEVLGSTEPHAGTPPQPGTAAQGGTAARPGTARTVSGSGRGTRGRDGRTPEATSSRTAPRAGGGKPAAVPDGQRGSGPAGRDLGRRGGTQVRPRPVPRNVRPGQQTPPAAPVPDNPVPDNPVPENPVPDVFAPDTSGATPV